VRPTDPAYPRDPVSRIDFTNGRRIWATVVDDTDPDVLIASNVRGRRLVLFRRLIKAVA
jgi:hypothetical protein